MLKKLKCGPIPPVPDAEILKSVKLVLETFRVGLVPVPAVGVIIVQ